MLGRDYLDPFLRGIYLFPIVLLWVFFFTNEVFSLDRKQQDPFSISGVSVDRVSESADRARDLALSDGRETAFSLLLDRLVMRKDLSKISSIRGEKLYPLVASIEIQNERNSRVRYIATLKVGFSKKSVRRLLRDFGVGFSETFSKPILLLPVLQDHLGTFLWDQGSGWLKAWEELVRPHSLLKIKVPKVNDGLEGLITAEQAATGDESHLEAARKQFGTAGILVVIAQLKKDPVSTDIIVTFVINRYRNLAPDFTEVRSLRAPEGGSLVKLFSQAAGNIFDEISELWKFNTRIQFEDPRLIRATAYYSNLREWISLRNSVESDASVQHIVLSQVSRTKAVLEIHYYGDPNQLKLRLAQKNIDLSQEVENWSIVQAGQKN